MTKRTRLHKAVGEANERLYGENIDARLGELARHFLLAARPTGQLCYVNEVASLGGRALFSCPPAPITE